jgi:hypothetical protein
VTRKALQTVQHLAEQVPYPAAAASVQAGALAQHAVDLDLIAPATTIAEAITALAQAHPALAGLLDPTINPMWTETPGRPAHGGHAVARVPRSATRVLAWVATG